MKDKDLLKLLKKSITKDFGKPCRDFVYGCPVCMVWLAFQILESGYGEEV